MTQQLIGVISSGITLIAGIVYMTAAFKGKVESNKVTWAVWTPVTIMLAFGYWQANGWTSSIWVPIMYVFVTFFTFLALQIGGKGGQWTWVEKSALWGAAIVIILWAIFHSGVLGMTLTLLVDLIGAIVIIISAYKHPEGEYPLGWYLGWLGNAINLFAIEKWDYSNAVYPLYLFFLTLIVSVLVTRTKSTKVHT
jgi:hypothetical protein